MIGENGTNISCLFKAKVSPYDHIYYVFLKYVYVCHLINRGYLGFFSVKDRNLFHRVDIIGNIFTSGEAMNENITDGVHQMKLISIFPRKKNSVYFMLLTLSGRSYMEIQYSSFPLFPVAYPSRLATHYNITSSTRNIR